MGLDESSYARQMGAIRALMKSLPSDWQPDLRPDRPLRTTQGRASCTTCYGQSDGGRTERSA